MILIEDITAAAERLRGVVHRTPVHSSTSINKLCNNELFFKCENFQRVGAFKIRGAYNMISSLTDKQLKKGVVAFSSGNHAQGVALAAALLNTNAKIVMPDNSPKIKVEATKGYGAEIVIYNYGKENRETIGKGIAEKEGRTLVPPFDHDLIIAGQGTVGLEFGQQVDALDYVFCPVGGGGLTSGCCIALKHLHPAVKIVGVETEAANDGWQSLKSGKIVTIDPPNTIADGMRTVALGERTFEIMRTYLDEMVLVSDSEVIEAMRWIFSRLKMVVEPTAAVPFAAVLRNELRLTGKRVGVILSGGNIDMDNFFNLLRHQVHA